MRSVRGAEGGKAGQSKGEMAIETNDAKQLLKVLQEKKRDTVLNIHTVVCSNFSSTAWGQELTAQFREHQRRSLAVGVCQCSHISQDLHRLFCSGAEAGQPPHSPSVLGCWVSAQALLSQTAPGKPACSLSSAPAIFYRTSTSKSALLACCQPLT